MNAAVTFQIGLNESARAIRGKFTFAGAWESCCRMRTEVSAFFGRLRFRTPPPNSARIISENHVFFSPIVCISSF